MKPARSRSKPANKFAELALPRLQEQISILDQRGKAYHDSWADDAPCVFAMAAERVCAGKKPSPAIYRLKRLAAMSDVKLARIQNGEFLEENFLDLGNYMAALSGAGAEVMKS